MRSVVAWVFVVLSSVGLACGGAPPPKSKVIPYKGPNTSDQEMASIEVPDSGAPAATTAEPPPTPAPAPTPTASTETKPPENEDPWLAHHQITPDEVIRTMRPSLPKVQACFREGLKRDPSAEGEVKIRFVIKHEGPVIVWRDEGSSMTDGDVTKCIGELIKTLKFPLQKAPGPAFGIYSIHLQR
jgi:hypothetical protein